MVVAVMPASKDSCPNRKIRTDGINDRKAAAKAMPAFSMLICGKYNERGVFLTVEEDHRLFDDIPIFKKLQNHGCRNP